MGETYTLITGASSGFGRSIAQKLAPSRKLVLAGRNAEKLEAVRRICEAPERHLLWVRDLSRVAGLGDELASLLVAKDIGIDHFIHSAGIIMIQLARATEMACVTEVFNVNLFSAMEIIRPLVQKKVNKGALRSITLISSIATRVGASGYGVYAASKGAVNAFSLSLAIELAPAVRVNAVLPGIVGTEMNRENFANPEFVASVRATHPLGLGCPEDVADAVEFLASDCARWITGQEIVVDGGRTIFAPPSRV
ncbi:MAG: SDR family oxidoreductase [Verrucomicrobiota bacterium]|jgi:NAD(P)-dependent dehydrogenase (short-subunit alcohol dehydrogenase family)